MYLTKDHNSSQTPRLNQPESLTKMSLWWLSTCFMEALFVFIYQSWISCEFTKMNKFKRSIFEMHLIAAVETQKAP